MTPASGGTPDEDRCLTRLRRAKPASSSRMSIEASTTRAGGRRGATRSRRSVRTKGAYATRGRLMRPERTNGRLLQ